MICPRCTKQTDGIHTCTPTDGWRKLEKQLAAAQLQIKLLQEAVIQMREHAEEYGQAWARAYVAEYRDLIPGSAKQQFDLLAIMRSRLDKVAEALALPADTSALEAMIANAGEVMRERCCRKAESMERDYPITGKLYAGNVSKKMRALPGVTMEDLKS